MRKLNKYLFVAKTNMLSTLSYSGVLFTSTAFYILLILIYLMLWSTIYGGQNSISGYTVAQLIWYTIVTQMIWESRSRVFDEINEDVRNGNITYNMNKPYSYIIYQLFYSLGHVAVRLGVIVMAGIILGLLLIGPIKGMTVYGLMLSLFSVILAILLNFFIMFCIGLTAFWSEDNFPFRWIYSKLTLLLGVMIPIEFLPDWAQSVIKYLPFSYTTYGPAKLVVDFTIPKFVQIAAIQSIYLILFVVLAFAIYSRGVKKLNVNGG